LADKLSSTSYIDSNLTNGQNYCYKVTAVNACGESAYSSVVCAVASNQGDGVSKASSVQTGINVKSGKTITFTQQDTFKQGDAIVLRTLVTDTNGRPISNAKVDLLISGASTVQLISNPSNAEGIAEVTWSTSAPNKKGAGGTTTGNYTVEVTNITATGYTWDGLRTWAAFTLN
jgi:hypothetical protein